MVGSKKYKTKLTERLHMAPRTGTPSISGSSEAGSSATRVSLEPLNLRGQFFTQDDDLQHIPIIKTPAPDVQGEVKRAGYFNRATGKGYAIPVEQGRIYEPKFITLVAPRATESKESKESEEPLRDHMEDDMPPSGIFRSIPFGSSKPKSTRLRSDKPDHESELSRADPFRGTTPMESPLPTIGSRYSVDRDEYFYNAPRGGLQEVTREHTAHPAGQKPSYGGAHWNDSTSPVRNSAFYGQTQRQHSYGGSSSNQSSSLKEQLASLTYIDLKSGKGKNYLRSYDKAYPPAYDEDMSYEPKYQKGRRAPKKWYGVWSTRKSILSAVAVILLTAFAVGLGVGLWENRPSANVALTPTWRPAIGTTWEIQLATPITAASKGAYIYELDLFENSAANIKALHSTGKRVICYFSVGTYESWRPDASSFPKSVIGKAVSGRANESYVDIRSSAIFSIMNARLKLAIQNGCDGIDPDNVDVYQAESGFPLTQANAVDYVNKLGLKAHHSDVGMGLKNAPDLINATFSNVDWHLVEGCAASGDCERSQPFIQAGKPVFQIEYAANGTASVLKKACNAKGTHLFSTLIKSTELGTWSASCPFGDPQYEPW